MRTLFQYFSPTNVDKENGLVDKRSPSRSGNKNLAPSSPEATEPCILSSLSTSIPPSTPLKLVIHNEISDSSNSSYTAGTSHVSTPKSPNTPTSKKSNSSRTIKPKKKLSPIKAATKSSSIRKDMSNNSYIETINLLTKREVKLGLIKIPEATCNASDFCRSVVQEWTLCPSLSDDGKKRPLIFPLFDGAIIGRNLTKIVEVHTSNPVKCDRPKLNVGIPPDMNGISRKQIQVQSLSSVPSISTSLKTTLKKYENISNPTNFTSSQFLENIQQLSPTVVMQNSKESKNNIRILRIQLDTSTSGLSEDSTDPKLSFARQIIQRGETFTLKVGDELEVDFYTTFEDEKREQKMGSNAVGNEKKTRYIYRVVSYFESEENKRDKNHLIGTPNEENKNITLTNTLKSTTTKSFIQSQNTSTKISARKTLKEKVDGCSKSNINDSSSSSNNEINVHVDSLEKDKISVEWSDNTPTIFPAPIPESESKSSALSDIVNEKGVSKGNKIAIKMESTDDNMTKSTESKEKGFVVPKAHDRFRITKYVSDMNLTKRPMWFTGTANKVYFNEQSKTYKLIMKLDEKTDWRDVYPSPYVQMIAPDNDHRIDYALDTMDGSPLEMAYDSKPSKLNVGDLVSCHYQDGDFGRDAWYLGRIAFIDKDNQRFDVAYFDNLFECDIPFQEGNVRFVENGEDTCDHWFLGATFQYEDKLVTVKDIICDKESKFMNLQDSNGTLIVVLPYVEAAALLFEGIRAQKKIVYWPSIQRRRRVITKVDAPKSPTFSQSPIRKKRVVTSKTDANVSASTTPTQLPNKSQTRKVASETVAKDVTTSCQSPINNRKRSISSKSKDDNIVVTNNFELIDKQMSKRLKSKYKNAEKNYKPPEFIHTDPLRRLSEYLEEENEATNLTQDSIDLDFGYVPEKPVTNELHPTFANSLWRCLNSAEPHNGFVSLMMLGNVFNTFPNASFSRNSFGFVLSGPENEGIYIRDPNRIELTSTYLDLLNEKSHEIDIPRLSLIGPSAWNDLETILNLPFHNTDNLNTYTKSTDILSTARLRHLSYTLQMSSSSMRFITDSLNREINKLNQNDSTISFKNLLESSSPFVYSIIKHQTRETLKHVVRLAIKCWIRHGHWILCNKFEGNKMNTAFEQRCALNAESCLSSFGRLVCYFVWIYCSEQNSSFADKDCCFIIKDIVLSELAAATTMDSSLLLLLVPANSNKSRSSKNNNRDAEKYRNEILIRFLCSLATPFSVPLQINLAHMLDLSSELWLITGNTS